MSGTAIALAGAPAELYEALVAAGSPDDKARRAAEGMSIYEDFRRRVVDVEADTLQLKRDLSRSNMEVQSLRDDIAGLSRVKYTMSFIACAQMVIFIAALVMR